MRRQISWFRASALMRYAQHRKTALRNYRIARLLHRQKHKLSTCSFSLRFLCFLEDARLLQGCNKISARHEIASYDWRKNLPPTHLSYEIRKSTARSLYNDLAPYCKAVARMLRNVVLQLKIARLHCGYYNDVSLCLAIVLQICTTILRQPCLDQHGLNAKMSAICFKACRWRQNLTNKQSYLWSETG